MRGAFVIRLALETLPAQGRFEGCVEEVDSGMELRFRSTDELLRFLAQRFDATFDFSEWCHFVAPWAETVLYSPSWPSVKESFCRIGYPEAENSPVPPGRDPVTSRHAMGT